MENNYCVRTRGLTKKYSKFTLGALDLDIPEGFSTALIGANGAGKTTLIDILCGVTHRTDGEVTYFGDSRDISDPNLRERIGYCASLPKLSTLITRHTHNSPHPYMNYSIMSFMTNLKLSIRLSICQ